MTTFTKDLDGADLDYWVAKAHGFTPAIQIAQRSNNFRICVVGSARYAPSTDWSHGGPLFSDALISAIYYIPVDSPTEPGRWEAFIRADEDGYIGPTELIARARAYVGSKIGATVPDEVPA